MEIGLGCSLWRLALRPRNSKVVHHRMSSVFSRQKGNRRRVIVTLPLALLVPCSLRHGRHPGLRPQVASRKIFISMLPRTSCLLRGQNFLRPILTHAMFAERPFPNDNMRNLWVCDESDFAAMPANEDQPKHVIDAALKAKTFWFMTAALPLPSNHSLPLGCFPFDPMTCDSAYALVESL
jgi:hypothetical protein